MSAASLGEKFRNINESLRRTALATLAVYCATLSLWRLDSVTLYRDEADTALLAKDMVEHHVLTPRYFDGTQPVTHLPDGSDINDEQFKPVIPGWLQFYLEAAAFAILGVSTWSARFPFALIGLVGIFVVYRAGRLLLKGSLAYLPVLLAVTSIYALTTFRQARYYALVYLFTALLIFELCRYIHCPDVAKHVSFFVRLGIWGLLLDLSHWGGFAATWLSLSVFVFLFRDQTLTRRWIALSAVLAIPVAAEFAFIHLGFFLESPATHPLDWWAVKQLIRPQSRAIWSMIPLLFLMPAAIWLWKKRGSLDPKISRSALLAACVIVGSVGFTLLLARTKTESRYYLQILPPLALLGALVVAMLRQLGRPRTAILLGLGLLIWPNLAFNIFWSDECVERQLTANRSFNEPLIDYLSAHVRDGDTLRVFPTEQGQVIYFYLNRIHWVGMLDSSNAHARRFRHVLPADAYDDYGSPDWFVIWYRPIGPPVERPEMLSSGYYKVLDYRFAHPLSVWDRLPIWQFKGRLDGFEVWRKDKPPSNPAVPVF
jgi:hypothetical protein